MPELAPAAASLGLVERVAAGAIVQLHQGRETYGGLQHDPSQRSGLILPSESRTLASMTRALALTDEKHERLPLLVDALVGLGADDGWGTTNANTGALRALASEKPMYRCRECGYRGTRLYWQCPGCRAWDSTRACSRLDVAYVSDGTYAELP